MRAPASRCLFCTMARPIPRAPFTRHRLNKILKDLIVKSKSMAGHYAPYVPVDCHGLPIETQVEKELGGKGKGSGGIPQAVPCLANRYVEQHKKISTSGSFWPLNDPSHDELRLRSHYR
jgi:hypothetical protein